MPLLILVLFGMHVITEILVRDLLVCLKEKGKEILSDLALCSQGVD